MTPPPQIVQVNQVMMPSTTPSPPAAAAACDSGSSSSAPTGTSDAAANADPLTQDLHNSPESNDQSPSERLVLDDVAVKFNGVPLIDLSCPDEALLQRQVEEACRDGGGFQVINHGLSLGLSLGLGMESIEKAKAEAKEPSGRFFIGDKPQTYHRKEEYYPDKKLWRSYPKLYPKLVYNTMRLTMLEVVSKSLGLEGHESMWKVQGDDQGQHVAMNYYPPCTDQPGLTRGLLQAGHTDPNALTIHLLDQDSPAGMQIFRQGRWMDVQPHPGALLVTIGDKIEALSKGKYKSARYRMTVSPHKERISLPLGSFGCREGNATSTPSPSTGKSPAICI